MRNYYIFITFLGIFVLGLIIGGFMVAGSPYAQKALAEDQKRVSDFASIQSSITSYGYSHNNALPVSLSALKQQNSYLSIIDPVTKKTYDYKIPSPNSYQLCTTFSTDSHDKSSSSTGGYPYADNQIVHKKGYDCISYTVTSQANNFYTTPANIITITSPTDNEKICTGQSYTIKWNGAQNYKALRLTVKTPGTNITDYIDTVPAHTTSTSNTGEYIWQVKQKENYGKLGFGFQIVITEDSGMLAQLGSSGIFSIEDCNPTPVPTTSSLR